MTQEKTEPVVEKKKRRKARTLEEREADAQDELERVAKARLDKLCALRDGAVVAINALSAYAKDMKRDDVVKKAADAIGPLALPL